jgi:putative transposase
MILARYPTDLTDTQWAVLAPLIPAAKAGGRPRTTDMREVVNALFYVLRGGCQWRLLPKDFPPYQTVYDYFRSWRLLGTWERLHDRLRGDVRESPWPQSGEPSAGIIRQSDGKDDRKRGIRGCAQAPHRRRRSGPASDRDGPFCRDPRS